ncbi:MAG: alpha/beta hydrolase [Patescibacteria group bacterium]
MKNLIIIPGWAGTKETWQDFIKLAEKDFNVFCINMPCFGDESCPDKAWGVEDYAEFVKNKIKELNLQGEKILLGHSFGGQISAYLIAHEYHLVDKLILSGPAVFRPKNYLRRFFFFIIAKVGKIIFKLPLLEKFSVFVKKIFYRSISSPDYFVTSEIKKEIFKKIIRQDLTAILPNIENQTLIIWGDKDAYVSVKNASKLQKLIPDSELEIVAGGRHGLHIQMPEKFLQIIKKFTNR